MENIIKINNTDIMTLSGDSSAYVVKKGRLYLYCFIESRFFLSFFDEGNVIPNLAPAGDAKFIVSGTNETEAVQTDRSFIEDFDAKEKESLAKIYDNLGFSRAEIEDLENSYKSCNLIIYEKIQKNIQDDAERSVEHQKTAEGLYVQSLSRFSEIFSPKNRKNSSLLFAGHEQNIVKATKAVCDILGINIEPVLGKSYDDSEDGLQELAKDNNIRIRKVLLKDSWIHEDAGPMLAYYADEPKEISSEKPSVDDGFRPVALIPKGSSSYEIYDFQNEKKFNVNRHTADNIHPSAFMFYKPFHAKKVRIRDILGFILPEIKKDLIVYALLSLLSVAIGLLTPKLTQTIIDKLVPQGLRTELIQIAVLVLITTIASNSANIVKVFSLIRMETKSDSEIEAAVVDRLLKLPVGFFKDFDAGDLENRAMVISSIRSSLSDLVLSGLLQFIFSLMYLFQIFRYSSRFAKWGICLCIPPVLLTSLLSYLIYRYQKQIFAIEGKITGKMHQFLVGVEKIMITNSSKFVFSQWSQDYIKTEGAKFKAGKISNTLSIFNTIFPTVANMILYFLFMRFLKDPNNKNAAMSTGTFLAFLSSFGSFQGALLGLVMACLNSINMVPMYKRAKPIFDAATESEDTKPKISSLKGAIEVSHVNFRYSADGPLILKDVSISAKPGEFIALVGGSGAGKSTLLRLLLGFEQAESGAIYFDNQDMYSYDLASIRRQLGVVLQNDTVLQGTILSNIVGSSGKNIDDAWIAAKKVGFDKDIEEMPMGMHTMVQSNATTLSGGQKQRLIIARAIVRNPSVLFFDEATSALDNKTQAIVSKSLDDMNVTRVVVAHRLSTIINADRIYAFKDGEVVECGTYEELMARNGYFAELAKRQI